MSEALVCQQRLSVLAEDRYLFGLGEPPHNCELELAGVCRLCESCMDMRELVGEMLRQERAFLPGYYEAQTKQRTAYICKGMVRPLATSLHDRIVAMALLINGQRETAADLR